MMPFFRSIKRIFAGRKPFPPEHEYILKRDVRFYRKLNRRRKKLLQERLKIFMSVKIFEGCGGLTITDEMKVVISAYACLLILENPSDYYPYLRSILVYPDDYIAPVYEENPGGVITEGNERREGESWDSGSVVLSWADVKKTTQSRNNGSNLVIHEFAHQLDLQYGMSGSVDVSGNVLNFDDEWSVELAKTYGELVKHHRLGRKTGVLDLYGASHPAECFAVVLEAFIEKPGKLSIQYPYLYRMLSDFFSIDPARW